MGKQVKTLLWLVSIIKVRYTSVSVPTSNRSLDIDTDEHQKQGESID